MAHLVDSWPEVIGTLGIDWGGGDGSKLAGWRVGRVCVLVDVGGEMSWGAIQQASREGVNGHSHHAVIMP